MSASREKKQRRGPEPSEKLTQAQMEQAAYKKKVRTYSITGAVIAVLVAALLIWNSGMFQRRATAATIGDNNLSVSELSFYYNGMRYTYVLYGIVDSTKPDAEQMYNEEEGVSFRDFFLSEALANAQNIQAMYEKALEAGYTEADIQEDLEAEIASTKAAATNQGVSYKSLLTSIYGRYITAGIFEDLTARSLLANLYYSDVSQEESDSYTLEDLEAYYAEHPDDVDTFTYSYLYFRAATVSTTDDDGNTRTEDEIAQLEEEALAEAKEKAEAALAAYNEGAEISALIEEHSPTNSGDHTTATGTSSISSLYSEELLALDADEAALVEYEDTGYYVVVYHGRARNEDPTAAIRVIYVAAETTTGEDDAVIAPTDEAWAAAEATANQLLEQWNSGEKTAESFSALATANGMSNDGIITGVSSTSYTDDRAQWLFEEERTAGDTIITQYQSSSYYGYYITYFEEWEEATWMQNVRGTLTSEAMTEWMDGIMEDYQTALTDGAGYLGY